MSDRYFIGSDESGHDYVVPVNRWAEWKAWCEEMPPSGDAPIYAMRLEGNFTFTDPLITYGEVA